LSARNRPCRLVTVLGARPQFIKASVVSKALRETTRIDEIVVHTGQHFDDNLSQVFFAELGMAQPRYNLGVHGGTHAGMTGRMLIEIERVLQAEQPDAVLVYGDTNSTLAAALAAVKLRIRVAHVEAGLRSFNLAMPEEVNRVLTDRISTWLFTPTDVAAANLLREGFASEAILPVGDVMLDVALQHGGRVSAQDGLLDRLGFEPRGFILATIHRAENTEDPERMEAILAALEVVAGEMPVVWPLHPRTRNAIGPSRLNSVKPGVKLLEPVGYLDMVRLEKFAALIVTDSGGVQKEAFFHGVPCVTLRDETEWTELIDSGWNRLASPRNGGSLGRDVLAALGSHGQAIQPYGDGRASLRIAQHLETLC
jgi:UDP-GlcNAc3NAcA epimerase